MRFEKLELRGFKSFADKTEFRFQPGMTVFVGPNGCGKSNVVDAVKWVLGEQSVKALRGNEMQDVIFNGSPTRRSTGVAEVTLSLADTKGVLPTEYDSISVSRRLYRSGESEYLLNKQRCRLRDIRDLFMDTGIGMDAYSIIEQGKVEALLTANNQDRRAIFEEAAGISKYKTQKRTCLRKLDRVDTNLQRLNDIIDEVERRMRSVKYQAAKARRWKRLDDQRRELAVALALHRYDTLAAERDKADRELAEVKAKSGALHAAVERLEAELSELETAVIEAEQKISQLESEDVRISSRIQAAEDAIRMNEERIGELDKLEETTKAEIARGEAALEMMHAEVERGTAQRAELDEAIERGEQAAAERRKAVQQMDGRLAAIRADMEDKRAQVVDLANERAGCRNERASIT
ncbi:MAG: chromosome segregation SMC family protein, partial [Planctomycetota bacterium]